MIVLNVIILLRPLKKKKKKEEIYWFYLILYWPEDLRISFEQFGLIEDVYLPKDYYTGYDYFSFYISVCVFVMLFVIKYLESSTYSKIYIYIYIIIETRDQRKEWDPYCQFHYMLMIYFVVSSRKYFALHIWILTHVLFLFLFCLLKSDSR